VSTRVSPLAAPGRDNPGDMLQPDTLPMYPPVSRPTPSAARQLPRLTVSCVTEGRDRDGDLTGALFISATLGNRALSVRIAADGRVSKLDRGQRQALSEPARKTLAGALRRYLQALPWIDELAATALHRVTCSLYPSPDLTRFVARRIAAAGEHLVLTGSADGMTIDVVLLRGTQTLSARFHGPHDSARALTGTERVALSRALATYVSGTCPQWSLYAELVEAARFDVH